MSNGIKVQLGSAIHDSFSIKNICGCRLVYGSVPASEFGMLLHGFSKKALMAVDIADRIGASFVIGEPDDLDKLRKLDMPVSEKRHYDYLAANAIGLYDVAMWLRVGERGASSNAMCKRIFGVPTDAGIEHPCDPDDLRRCMLFLESTKASEKASLMADVSPAWKGLVEIWGGLVETFQKEMAFGKLAPQTYEPIKQAIREQ